MTDFIDSEQSSRISSIDAFRGFAIIGMVIVNYIAGISWMPAFLKHAPDVGLTVADFIAPFFIFAIGLNYRASFDRRMEKDGFFKTAGHFAGRYLAIAGIGAIFAAGEPLAGESANWGVLQAIGMAGLVCLLFIRLNKYLRLIIGLAMLAVYQLILNTFMLGTVLSSSHGGLFGSVSWSAMLLLSTYLADEFRQNKNRYTVVSVLFLAAVVLAALVVPVSKNRVSASYVLITLAAGALLFRVFDLIFKTEKSGSFLIWWGANPLLLYVLHQILLGFIVLPGIPAWYQDAPVYIVTLQAIFLLGVLTFIARALYRRKVFIKL